MAQPPEQAGSWDDRAYYDALGGRAFDEDAEAAAARLERAAKRKAALEANKQTSTNAEVQVRPCMAIWRNVGGARAHGASAAGRGPTRCRQDGVVRPKAVIYVSGMPTDNNTEEELAEFFTKRCGIVKVDFETGARAAATGSGAGASIGRLIAAAALEDIRMGAQASPRSSCTARRKAS